MERQYVKAGLRNRAADLCTAELGYRSEMDAAEAERREIRETRYTSLDRLNKNRARYLPGSEGHIAVTVDPETGRAKPSARPREQHLAARLQVLHSMHLSAPASADTWFIRSDFETVLRAMQRATDRQKTLASRAALLSDPRLPMQVTDHYSLRWLEGRVVSHGEEETTGRAYMLLEGTDGRVHFIYHEGSIMRAWEAGNLRPNSFVRLRRVASAQALRVTDLGDADQVLNDKQYFLSTAARLLKRGVLPDASTTAGWLGKYQQELARVVGIIGARRNDSMRFNEEPSRNSLDR